MHPNAEVWLNGRKLGENHLPCAPFGFVTLTPHGRRLCIHGKPHFMRAHGDFELPPETGCPDTDRERWRKKLAALRAYGYNHVRCQSFVPTPEYRERLKVQGDRVVERDVNHPYRGGQAHALPAAAEDSQRVQFIEAKRKTVGVVPW